jgi:hypothetical protein
MCPSGRSSSATTTCRLHLDYNDQDGSPYYEVKLLCNDEDLAGAPVALRAARRRVD